MVGLRVNHINYCTSRPDYLYWYILTMCMSHFICWLQLTCTAVCTTLLLFILGTLNCDFSYLRVFWRIYDLFLCGKKLLSNWRTCITGTCKKVNENNLNCISFLLGKILFKLTNRSWPWFKQQSKTIMPGESCLSPPIKAYSSELFSPLLAPPHIHLHLEDVDKKLNYTWDKELMYCNDRLTIGKCMYVNINTR